MKEKDIHNQFAIRDYRHGDYDQISYLWEVTEMGGHQRGDTETIIEDTIQKGGRMLIMESLPKGNIIGTSWMTFDGRRIHLHHFGILPVFQGKGLSKILLNESLEHIKGKGYQVKLEVHSANFRAKSLYRKAGFQHLNDYEVYIIRNISKL